MNELVFLEPNQITSEPFTTSEVIAEYAQISHHSVQQLISKHEHILKSFGLVAFEMRAAITRSGTKYVKNYRLSEQQVSLLFTFFRNTEPVIRFKTELVKQFFIMRKELVKRQVLRESVKPIRRGLTDVIKEINHSKWDYKLYTDLIYKSVTGMTAAQLRYERGAKPSDTAMDYMTSAEIGAIIALEDSVGVLLEMGLDYQEIKEVVLNKRMLKSNIRR